MKLDKNAGLQDFNGKPLNIADDKPLTLGWLCLEVLQMTFEDEKGLSGEEKMKRFYLAHRISRNKAPNLTTEETVLVKTLVAKVPHWGPLIVGQAWELLEGKPGMAWAEKEAEESEPAKAKKGK
jgi:hypothetical protein